MFIRIDNSNLFSAASLIALIYYSEPELLIHGLNSTLIATLSVCLYANSSNLFCNYHRNNQQNNVLNNNEAKSSFRAA
jgi:hypothetical protein